MAKICYQSTWTFLDGRQYSVAVLLKKSEARSFQISCWESQQKWHISVNVCFNYAFDLTL